MRHTKSSRPNLKHLAFFEVLAEADEGTLAFRAATAGLLALRLVDNWVAAGPAIVEPESASVSSVRTAIMALPSNDPQRAILLGLVNTMQTLREPDLQPVLPRIYAFAGSLERKGQLALAADAYETVIRFGEERFDGELIVDSYLRLGFCLRMLGSLPESERAYAVSEKMAKARRQTDRVLHSQIGLANVAMARGNLPRADEMLGKIVQESIRASCRAEHAKALHLQSVVAQRRGDLNRAVCLSYDALQLTDAPNERDRVLNDIGAYFIVMERYEAARDALLVLEATTTVEPMRWAARVNLLSLAARSGDRPFFESMRGRIEGYELRAETAVNYLIESARGFRRFGEPGTATRLLDDAYQLAEEHGLSRSMFEAEQMRRDVETVAHTKPGEILVADQDPAAQVVAGLRLMAAAIES